MDTPGRFFDSAAHAEAAFYDALVRADIDAMMRSWSEDDGIVCIHPGGARLIGLAEVRASWESIFSRSRIRVRPILLHAISNPTTAVHNLVEDIDHDAEEIRNLHILATNIYMRTASGWRMVMHHASIAPGRATPARAAATVLH